MKSDWWISVLQWTFWWLAMGVVMGWLAKSRLRKRPEAERYTLVHPVSTLVLGIVGAAFFFGIAIISNTVGKNSTATVWTTLGFVAFGLAAVLMIMDYVFARHRLSEQGIEYGRMFGQRGRLRWSEVKTVRFSPGMKWFLLKADSGTTIRVSAMLLGLPEFARLVLLHVPKGAIEPETRAILDETQNGSPPGLWR